MRQNSFNIVHLAIALLCVVVFVTIAIAVSQTNHHHGHHPMQHRTQIRGIHQGLVVYANSNKNWFPGINAAGEDEAISVEQRFRILIDEDYFTPEYAVSPLERSDSPIEAWDTESELTKENYSFSLLQIPAEGGRRNEWRQSLNSQAIVLSDRNTETKARPSSIQVEPGESWAGHVLWNDSHVVFENTDSLETKYGGGKLNDADRLFESSGNGDALMVHTGNGKD